MSPDVATDRNPTNDRTPLGDPTPVGDAARMGDPQWWRSAVVYQIYPRSFADGNGDGIGDLAGMTSRLDYLGALGVDAVWISPWYPSPLADGGYDVADFCDIDPRLGTLEQADEFVARAHERGIRVIIDLVPNHCSHEHELFRAAVAAGPGSPERDMFVFHDGKGPDGAEPPTNWVSEFGGPAWHRLTDAEGNPEQWYLHLFAPEQPDWNWSNPKVADFYDDVLRFWFDRGIDGFRIDVADSCAMDMSLPDLPVDPRTGEPTREKFPGHPTYDRPELETIQRRWRAVADEYVDTPQGGRVFVSEAYLDPIQRLTRYVEPGRLHTTFNFDALLTEWDPDSQRAMVTNSLAGHRHVGAPCTWVLGNHDQPRVASRLGRAVTGAPFRDGALGERAHKGPDPAEDIELGRRRARAAALLELALPGGAYVYQGEELGLDEVDLPVEVLQDPTWEQSGHTDKGRDGCRVPLPWSGEAPPYGFSQDPGAVPWLPQPAHWAGHTVADQTGTEGSFLELYRAALALRRDLPALGAGPTTNGDLVWDETTPEGVLGFHREPGFTCWVNFSEVAVELPAGTTVTLSSSPLTDGLLGTDQAVWLRR